MGEIQSGITPNFTELYNEKSEHVAHIIEQSLKKGATTIEASEKAEAGWLRAIRESANPNPSFQLDCTPGYYNNEGKPGEGQGWFGGTFGGGAQEYFKILKAWRAKGGLQGLELS
jgi:cyclohexanone monooxygenase